MSAGVPTEAFVCVFIFLSLLIGAAFRELYRKFHIPFTPALLVFGILIGGLSGFLGPFGDLAKAASNLDPHGIIILFIPILLFESAMNADWYIFKKSFANILMLAGPGVVFNILFTGVCIRLILYPVDPVQNFSWEAAFTLSAIISTTDPVAVVALLKEVGAPPHFNTLVEGESLLNDGSAIVFFNLFLGLLRGGNANVEAIALDFVQFAGLGPIIGIIFGILGSYWLRRILRDEILVTCLTFCMCFLCFFVAEYVLKSSGILAVVACGLFMAVFGKTKIDHQSEHSLHSVWGFLQWNCETIIFFLAGLVIGVQPTTDSNIIDIYDWLKMFGLYVCITIGRLAMIFTFYPFLRKSGFGLNWREAIVLCYGGLRGAISLALALVLKSENDSVISQRTKQLLVFHAAGMATLTMLINATTAGWVIKKLKAIKVTAAKSKIKANFLAEMQVKANHKLADLQKQKYYEICDWDEAKRLVGLNEEASELFTQKILKSTDKALTVEHDTLAEVRFRLLKIIKKMFWESFGEGQLSSQSILLLSTACDSGIDKISKPIMLWDYIYSHFLRWRGIRIMQFLMKCPLLTIPARKYIARYISLLYQVTTTFILVAEDVIDNQDEGVFGKAHFQTVIDELKKNLLNANNYLITIQDSFADTIRAIQVRRAAFNIIHYQIHILDEALDEGQIEKNEYNEIRNELDKKILKLDKVEAHSVWSVPTFDDFVVQFPVFSILTKTQSAVLKDAAQTKVYNKGDSLYIQHYKVTDLFVITKGVVKEYYSEGEENGLNKGIGSILSFANAVEKHNIALSNCVAQGYVELKKIPIDLVKKIMTENQEFEEQCYKNALINFVRCPSTHCKELSTLDDKRILEFAENAKVIKLKAGETVIIEHGAIIFEGRLIRNQGGINSNNPDEIVPVKPSRKQTTRKVPLPEEYDAVSYVPRSEDIFEVNEATVLLIFQIGLKQFADEMHRSVPVKVLEHTTENAAEASIDSEIHTRTHRSRTTNLSQAIEREKAVENMYSKVFGKRTIKLEHPEVRESVEYRRNGGGDDDLGANLQEKL